jgi:hypothetical protein
VLMLTRRDLGQMASMNRLYIDKSGVFEIHWAQWDRSFGHCFRPTRLSSGDAGVYVMPVCKRRRGVIGLRTEVRSGVNPWLNENDNMHR